ncbi:uncharacterized protein N7498_004416 [Penicillium cinerascens]|uniref:Uncharacterized protein n=1 Tax=Penicillium cinerascens TaxID=70096 RepID=A0A9W9N3W8_9EURO|nr:uncharacterized protein N7498_004416 [Penicillium cinerascens]KAJ5212770.1 hypothetical protein N7498_004416 [Penicillium cinerascens]
MLLSERTFLTSLENKNRKLAITTTTPEGSVLSTWVLGNYLSGQDMKYTEDEVKGATRHLISYTWASFACHLDGDENKKAIVRIHCQVPHIGTELDTVEEKRTQVDGRERGTNIELSALQNLQDSGVVPRLLAWQQGKQGDDGPVPGGFVDHIVWEKVPGESLNDKTFWEFSLEKRNIIREQFRIAYLKVARLGLRQRLMGESKIIWDDDTETLHLAGFRIAVEIDPTEEWSDEIFVSGYGDDGMQPLARKKY